MSTQGGSLRLGIEEDELPHLVGGGPPRDYRDAHTDRARHIVERYHWPDIRLFDYSFTGDP